MKKWRRICPRCHRLGIRPLGFFQHLRLAHNVGPDNHKLDRPAWGFGPLGWSAPNDVISKKRKRRSGR